MAACLDQVVVSCVTAVFQHVVGPAVKCLAACFYEKVLRWLRRPPPCVEMPVPGTTRGGRDPKLCSRVLRCLDEAKEGTVVGLWGIIGVGKSTLLKRINNAFLPGQSRPKDYDYVIYLEVHNCDAVERLQENLAKRLGLNLGPGDQQPVSSSLKEEISSELKKKSFLLLLEDLWGKLDLEKIGVPAPVRHIPAVAAPVAPTDDPHRKPKQHIVFTTNFKEVCDEMDARHSIEVERLSDKESLQLLEETVGKEISSTHSDMLKKIAKLCNGVPRVLISIGKKLPKDSDWSVEYDNLRNGMPLSPCSNSGPIIYSHYGIYYERLAAEWKRRCFLACSFWPGDDDIPKYELIGCWMGLGFINAGMTADENYDIGNSLIREFMTLHLLEKGDSATTVRISHFARGFARLQYPASEERNFGQRSSKWEVRASESKLAEVPVWDKRADQMECVSFMHMGIGALPQTRSSCPRLKILILKGNRPLRKIPGGVLLRMTALEYLDLSNTGLNELTLEIGGLLELQYLNLSRTSIRSLPEELGKLVKLKYLILSHIETLRVIPPALISKFEQLNLLDVTGRMYGEQKTIAGGTDRPVEMQRRAKVGEQERALSGIRARLWELICLDKGLKAVGITVCSVSVVRLLSKRKPASVWHLEITELKDLSGPLSLLSDDLLGSYNIRKSVKELFLSYVDSLEDLVIEYDVHGEGQGTRDDHNASQWRFERLEVLELSCLNSLKEIVWKGVVPNILLASLKDLKIYRCHKLEHVSWVLILHHLVCLKLSSCHGLRALTARGSEEEGEKRKFPHFQNLRALVLEDLPMLTSICHHKLAFPSLECLHLSKCPSLEKLPFSKGIVANGKLKAIRSQRDLLDRLEWDDVDVKEFAYSILN